MPEIVLDPAAAAAEAKAAADAAAVLAAAAPPAPAARVVPESYTLALPEKSLLAATVTDRVSAFAKANGLTQTEAEGVLGFAHAEVGETLKTLEAANAGPSKAAPLGGPLYQARVAEMEKAALAHPDLGNGDPMKLKAAVLKAQLFLTQEMPELAPLLDRSGEGSNPDVILVLNRLAARIAERPHVKDMGAPPDVRPTRGRDFYAPDGGKLVAAEATA